MNVVGPSTAVLPVLPPAVIAIPRVPPRRPSRRDPVDDVIDDVPYVIVEEPRQRARSSAPSRRRTRRAAADVARGIWSAPGAGRRTSEQLQALRAYSPYEVYRGVFIDLWV